MTVNGKIKIDVERKTITLQLDNGSYCFDLYTNGLKRFLDEEIEFLGRDSK